MEAMLETPQVTEKSSNRRAPGSRASRGPAARPAKRALAQTGEMKKVSVYLNARTADLLELAALMLKKDQSDIVEETLAKHMPSFAGRLSRLVKPDGSGDMDRDREAVTAS